MYCNCLPYFTFTKRMLDMILMPNFTMVKQHFSVECTFLMVSSLGLLKMPNVMLIFFNILYFKHIALHYNIIYLIKLHYFTQLTLHFK